MKNNKIKAKNYKHIKMIGVIVVLALNSFILGNINKLSFNEHSNVKAMNDDKTTNIHEKSITDDENVTNAETTTNNLNELKKT